MPYEKVTPESDPDGHSNQNLATTFDDPATVKRAEAETAGQAAQVTPKQKKKTESNPECAPPPGDWGPAEGPGS